MYRDRLTQKKTTKNNFFKDFLYYLKEDLSIKNEIYEELYMISKNALKKKHKNTNKKQQSIYYLRT